MEICPNIWCFRTSSEIINDNKLMIKIKSKLYCKMKSSEIRLNIYRCIDNELNNNTDLKMVDWKWKDYFNFGNADYWEKYENIQIFKESEENSDDNYNIKIFRNEFGNKNLLLKFCLQNTNFHIIDIFEKTTEDKQNIWNNCLINYNKYVIRDLLLNNLKTIKLVGTPGQIHCFGKNSIGLLGGTDGRKETFGWCSATSIYGEGVVLCFSHESFLFEDEGHNFIATFLNNLSIFRDDKQENFNIAFLGFTDEESQKFVKNLNKKENKYLRCSYFENLDFRNIQEVVFNHDVDIIVLNGNCEKGESIDETIVCSEVVREYVYSGKILIIGLCLWGWKQINCTQKIKNQLISNEIIKELGMVFIDEYFSNKEDFIEIKDPEIRFSNSYYYWTKFLSSINKYNSIHMEFNKEELYILIRDIETILNTNRRTNEQIKILFMILEFLKNDFYLNLNPPFNLNSGFTILFMAIANTRMIENSQKTIIINGKLIYSFNKFDNWINKNLFWKSDFKLSNNSSNNSRTNDQVFFTEKLICPIYNIRNEWQNTGVYLRSINLVKIEFIPCINFCSEISQAEIHIGSHTDFLRYKEIDILKRIPLISKKYSWNINESNYIVVESACDGILYFVFIDDSELLFDNFFVNKTMDNFRKLKQGYLNITLLNNSKLILSPIYTTNHLFEHDLNDNRIIVSDKKYWEKLIFNLKNCKYETSEWMEIHGKNIIFVFPIKTVFKMDYIFLNKMLNFWDHVVEVQNDLYNNKKWAHERIVCDIQISDGYMHSGYPIMTHMDIVDEVEAGFLDLDVLKKEGNWGIYHEIGHNRQSNDWTFDGTEEVTVNLFSMYTYSNLHPHKSPFEITYIKDQIEISIEYLKEIRSLQSFPEKIKMIFDTKWRSNHGIAFINYLILVIFFKWEVFKTIFKIYEKLSLINNNEIRAQSYQYKMFVWIFISSSVTGIDLKHFFKEWGWGFCTERAQSDIDILSLCVKMQNQLFNLKEKLCVKREIFETDIWSGYEDISKINRWKPWNFNSLEFLLQVKNSYLDQ